MTFLNDALLDTIHGRADRYDAENTFPFEDLDDLRAAVERLTVTRRGS